MQSLETILDASQYLLPLLTTAIGLGAFTIGILSPLNPKAASWLYGCSPPTRGLNPHGNVNDLRYLHALSIRNIAIGLTVLCITAFWQSVELSEVKRHDVAFAIRKTLGIVIQCGSVVPISDAVNCGYWGTFDEEDVVRRRRYETGKGCTVIKGAGARNEPEESDSGSVGRDDTRKWAGIIHATRSIFWLIAGLWCLFGSGS